MNAYEEAVDRLREAVTALREETDEDDVRQHVENALDDARPSTTPHVGGGPKWKPVPS